jgi:hypothetical protein
MGRTVTGAPYSGVEVVTTQRVMGNGNTIQRSTQTSVYRDSAGRTRVEQTLPARGSAAGQSTRTVVTIHDPVAHVMHTLDPQARTDRDVTIRGGGRGSGSGARPFQGRGNAGSTSTATGSSTRPADPNTVTENLAMQTINGVQATGTRVTRTIPAGKIGNAQAIQTVHETWYSADLKMPVMVKTSDPRTGTTTRQLTNITRAEPDPALFQVPADYTVTSPRGRAMRGGPGGGQGR